MGEVLDALDREYKRMVQEGLPRQLLEYQMASRLIWLALGEEWYRSKVALSDDPDSWMLNGNDNWLNSTNPLSFLTIDAPNQDARRVLYNFRVVRLANSLFTLLTGEFSGLEIVRRRFQTRDAKPCFIEVEIASLLVFNGFSVQVKAETGRLGADFDLSAQFKSEQINVEVTSKDDGKLLDVRTVRNTLSQKRKQLPADAPAALYIQIPGAWMKQSDVFTILTQAVAPFCKGSSRINAFVFVWETVVSLPGGGFPSLEMRSCFNKLARHPFSALSRLDMQQDKSGQFHVSRSFLESFEARHRENSHGIPDSTN